MRRVASTITIAASRGAHGSIVSLDASVVVTIAAACGAHRSIIRLDTVLAIVIRRLTIVGVVVAGGRIARRTELARPTAAVPTTARTASSPPHRSRLRRTIAVAIAVTARTVVASRNNSAVGRTARVRARTSENGRAFRARRARTVVASRNSRAVVRTAGASEVGRAIRARRAHIGDVRERARRFSRGDHRRRCGLRRGQGAIVSVGHGGDPFSCAHHQGVRRRRLRERG